jgi:hypothetical protein
MNLRSSIQKIAYWIIPGGIYNRLTGIKGKMIEVSELKHDPWIKAIQPNINLKNIYKGKRCFVLCNGPSVNSQDLRKLKDEIVFSVSNGYHHSDYLYYQPAFHCVPQITYSEKYTERVVVDWFSEMDKRIGTATLFLNTSEYDLVQKYNLFPNRPVYYTYLGGIPWDNKRLKPYDISEKIPGAMSVPIMCLIIAIFMGFEEIYLLGTEHDALTRRKYNYFYDNSKTVLADKQNVSDDGRVFFSFSEGLFQLVELWKEYQQLDVIAKHNNTHIFNATIGGDLDVFPRVEFAKLFT